MMLKPLSRSSDINSASSGRSTAFEMTAFSVVLCPGLLGTQVGVSRTRDTCTTDLYRIALQPPFLIALGSK